MWRLLRAIRCGGGVDLRGAPESVREWLGWSDDLDGYRTAPWCAVWEIFSGSSSLSAHAKKGEWRHLFPLDYRYGWDLSNPDHQVLALEILNSVEINTLFASQPVPRGATIQEPFKPRSIGKKSVKNRDQRYCFLL